MTRFEFKCLQADLIKKSLKVSRALAKVEHVLEGLPGSVLLDRKGQLQALEQSVSKIISEILADIWREVESSEHTRLRNVSGGK